MHVKSAGYYLMHFKSVGYFFLVIIFRFLQQQREK